MTPVPSLAFLLYMLNGPSHVDVLHRIKTCNQPCMGRGGNQGIEDSVPNRGRTAASFAVMEQGNYTTVVIYGDLRGAGPCTKKL
jgi:hypothetical protein